MAELKSWVGPARPEAAAAGIGFAFAWFLTLDGKHIAQGIAPTEEAARRAVMDARDEFIAAECDEIDCRSIPL